MKIIKTAPCIVIFCIAMVAGCGNNLRTVDDHERWRSGWVNAHSFRVHAVGAIRGTAGSGRNSRHAAVEMAKKIVTENFTAARYSAIRGDARSYRNVRAEVIREFSHIINNGKVVSANTGSGKICTIMYEVHGNRLQEKVLNGQLHEEGK